MGRKFKLFRVRRPSLKTAFGVTGAKRRVNDDLKRLFGIPTRRRSFWARLKTAQRQADREARHQAAVQARAARYQYAAIAPPVSAPLAQMLTSRGLLTLTAHDIILQPSDGTPVIVIPRRSITHIEHYVGIPPIFGWRGTMRLIFHTRDRMVLRIPSAPYPNARQFLAAIQES